MVERRLEDAKGSNNQAVITTDNYRSTVQKEQSIASKKKENLQLQRPHLGLSKFKEAARKIVPVAVGALALEAVILFSFSSIEGLYLVISTLAVGTSVYVSDGIKR